ncbi:C2H2 zinc finger [Fusarium agapanthi]|uniref:C2H2 zinc finger n=1 Tax=Fusarium agapanthi TaxID=1803897 RepID=A0A9P5EH08_9HYPO|nr:C2H2 zinc finger [Fusarium agapanthi]
MLLKSILTRMRLPSADRAVSNVWINDDIRPLEPERRTWNTMTFISFWLVNQVAISNWQLGASLVATGLSVWQVIIATLIGKVIISLVAIFNGYTGAEWHIGFPVVSRYIWGPYGSFIAIVQRIILSLVWFSVQSWTGGLCISVILSAMFPSFQRLGNVFPESSHLDTKQFVGWILFNVSMIPVLWIHPHKIKRVLLIFNIIASVTLISIMIWSLVAAKGGGPLLSESVTPMSSHDLGWAITSGVTTVIGGIAVGLTNANDYTRFAQKPGDQVFGQWFSIIFFGTLFPLFGCLAASATQGIWGEAIWNPPLICQQWLDRDYSSGSRAAAFFAGLGLVMCQIAINVVDNAYSAGMDLAGLVSSYINIRRGAFIALVLSVAMCPWELLSSASVFISVLSAYSVFLGPIIGIQVCDYWLIRSRRIKLSDLYNPGPTSIYYFSCGFNPRSFIAWFLGFATQLPGFAAGVTPNKVKVGEAWHELFYLAFPLGFAISFTAHYVINRVFPPAGLGLVDDMDYFGSFTEAEAIRLVKREQLTMSDYDPFDRNMRVCVQMNGEIDDGGYCNLMLPRSGPESPGPHSDIKGLMSWPRICGVFTDEEIVHMMRTDSLWASKPRGCRLRITITDEESDDDSDDPTNVEVPPAWNYDSFITLAKVFSNISIALERGEFLDIHSEMGEALGRARSGIQDEVLRSLEAEMNDTNKLQIAATVLPFLPLDKLCGGMTRSVDEPVESYIALSYPRKSYDSQDLEKIIAKVYGVLNHRYYWVDRWCIDQDSYEDKETEVPKMKDYYSNTKYTLILPGMEFPLELAQLKAGGPKVRLYSPQLVQQVKQIWESCEWRKRCWTLQEAIMSKRCTFWTGQESAPLIDSSELVGILCSSPFGNSYINILPHLSMEVGHTYKRTLVTMSATIAYPTEESIYQRAIVRCSSHGTILYANACKRPLARLLDKICGREATLELDEYYSLFSMASDKLPAVDYRIDPVQLVERMVGTGARGANILLTTYSIMGAGINAAHPQISDGAMVVAGYLLQMKTVSDDNNDSFAVGAKLSMMHTFLLLSPAQEAASVATQRYSCTSRALNSRWQIWTQSASPNTVKVPENEGISKDVMSHVVDVSDDIQVGDWIVETVKRFGHLDGAANIAGIFKPISIFDSTVQDWDLMMNVNAKGVFNCLQAQIAGIGDRGGSIVTVASAAGIRALPSAPVYAASKHAVVGLCASVAAEVGSKNIRVNTVAPGFIDTPMTQSTVPKNENGEPSAGKKNPIARAAHPVEVAGVIVFLLSDQASFREARSGEMDGSHLKPREPRHDEARTPRHVAKRHQCPKPGCGKSFSRPSHLARHALNHSAVEFECPRCAASFKRRDLLERHKARHASKDRLAGGLGLGILRTKRHRRGRVIRASSSPTAQRFVSSRDQSRTMAMGHPGADMISSVIPEHLDVSESHESTIGHFQQTTERSASFNEGTSTEPREGILNTDGFDFLELGDMYHDSTFDFMHFNVTGDPHSPKTLRYLSLVPGQDDLPVLPPKSHDFDQEGHPTQGAPALHSSTIRTPTAGRSPDPDEEVPSLQSTGACSREAIDTSSNSAEVDSLCSLGRLGLNNLHMTETKRREILGLINDMRPVYPDGTSIDESTADLSLAQMQNYLDLFFANFNSCYPMIHTPTLEVLDAEPLFLLSLIVLGATYKEKEDHQLSVCLYDAMTPYIMSGLSGIKAIRRLSRYHVRARIMVPDLRTDHEKDWKAFAYLEQYKRLILFIFMWDTQNVSYYSFMPSMSTQSIQVNLPCSKELWEAKDEDAWQAIISSKSDSPMINTMVKEFIEDGGSIWCEPLDSLSLSFILHGLMSMCNDMVHFHNQSIYLGNAAQGDNDSRRRMTAALELWKTKYDACAMGTRQTIDQDSSLHEFRQENVAFLALYHTAHIVVDADIRHLQIAAGAEAIFGHVVTGAEREESTKAVMEWVRLSPDSAGHAAWHAAQMIREGLLNLRNWKANGMFHYPWCLYIGVLTTWAFLHFSQGQSDNRRGCHHSVGGEDILQTQSKALMHQTISNMASCTPATIGRDLHRCCPHGLAIEVAKYLKTVRWTAAFEAMKVLEGIVDMESL